MLAIEELNSFPNTTSFPSIVFSKITAILDMSSYR
jgi:hypothetical protein